VIETVNRLFIATDNRDWSGVRTCFSDTVLFDMTSVAGGQPVRTTPHNIVDGWEEGLKGLKAIHHQAGNHIVTVRGAEADAFCYGIAIHYLPNPTGRDVRVFVGSYDFHLLKNPEGWRINSFKFNLKFVTGNMNLQAAIGQEP
jgi:hypothetical protein